MDSYDADEQDKMERRKARIALRNEIASLTGEEMTKRLLDTHDQMIVNNDYAQRYSDALKTICIKLGWEPRNNPGCFGVPEDFDILAVRLVEERFTKG